MQLCMNLMPRNGITQPTGETGLSTGPRLAAAFYSRIHRFTNLDIAQHPRPNVPSTTSERDSLPDVDHIFGTLGTKVLGPQWY